MRSVLIVEDDGFVRELLRRAFAARAWRVWASGSATDALRLARRHRPDLLLLDVVLPGMSGPDLLAAIRRHQPHVRALLMSGYPERHLVQQRCDTTVAPLLQKPFSIRAALARAGALV